MPTIVVDVMPKAELLDPQGKAVAGALARLGYDGFEGVRIGKRFELTVADASAETHARNACASATTASRAAVIAAFASLKCSASVERRRSIAPTSAVSSSMRTRASSNSGVMRRLFT